MILVGAGLSAWGHPRAADPAWLGVLGNGLHVVAAGIWVGGLLALVITLRVRKGDPGVVRIVGRVSQLAAVSVGLLVIGGLSVAWSELGGLAPLFDTDYGRLLLVKLGLLGLVLAGAAYNRYRLVPSLEADPEHASDRLRSTLLGELGGLLLIVLVTTVLVDVTPPVNKGEVVGAATPGAAGAVVDGLYHDEVEFPDGTTLSLDLLPGRAGFNEMHMTYLAPDGALADITDGVELSFSLPSAELGPIEQEATRLTPGHFTYEGSDLSIPGDWEIVVTTRTSRFEQEESTFTVGIE
jgi:copper transport protein